MNPPGNSGSMNRILHFSILQALNLVAPQWALV